MGYDIGNLHANLDLSTYCNASCPQCHRTDQEDISKKVYWLPLIQWSTEEFKKRFSVKSLNYYRSISICGTWGDPMMNKDIFDIVKFILENNSRVHVTINTNGSMRDEEFWWKLGVLSYENMKRLKVIFDVDGVTQEQHERYRRGTTLSKVLDNMKAFTDAQAPAQVYTVIFDHNENSINDIADLVYKYGAKSIYVCPSNRFDKNPEQFRFISEGKIESLFPSNKETNFRIIDLPRKSDED